ncbi:MAG: hypothetical protein U9Q06_02950 [Nanoarchaeota archaeon]|nr:hypothetical protein [Nanoarchaeota archaeon]
MGLREYIKQLEVNHEQNKELALSYFRQTQLIGHTSNGTDTMAKRIARAPKDIKIYHEKHGNLEGIGIQGIGTLTLRKLEKILKI